MSQVHCPRCKDAVRIPADLPSAAILRCPLCAEEYPFSEVEAGLPPLVEIVSLPESADEALSQIDDLLSPKAPAANAPLVTAPRVTTSAAGLSMARRRPAESPWRPLILLVEVGLAGVVGIALAVLLLWWLPGQWHRDPLSLKPVAAKYAPWLLPPAHRPFSEVAFEEEEPAPERKRASSQSSTKPKATKPSNPNADAPNANALNSDTEKPPARSKPVNFEEPALSNEPSTEDKNAAQKPAAEPRKQDSSTAAPQDRSSRPAATKMEDLTKGLPPDHWLNQPEAPPEPPDLAWTNSPEISSLLREAERRRKEPPSPKLDFAGRPEPDFVATFRELARVAGQINSEDVGLESARGRLRDWLATLTDQDWKSALEATAKDREKDAIAPRGVIYLAKLKQAAAEGSWLHLEIEPNPGDPTFPVLIDPANFRDCGGEALLGKEIYILASELPDPKRLVTDVPNNIKKTWLIGAIRPADIAADDKASSASEDKSAPQKSAF